MLAFVRRRQAAPRLARGIAYTRQFPSIVAALQATPATTRCSTARLSPSAPTASPRSTPCRTAPGSRARSTSPPPTGARLRCSSLRPASSRRPQPARAALRRAARLLRGARSAHRAGAARSRRGRRRRALAASLATGFEGVVGKRKASIYRRASARPTGSRSKRTSSAEFVIGGFSKGPGGGANASARWSSATGTTTGTLRYAANVGIGYDEATIDDLLARFGPLWCHARRSRRKVRCAPATAPALRPRARRRGHVRRVDRGRALCARRSSCACATMSIRGVPPVALRRRCAVERRPHRTAALRTATRTTRGDVRSAGPASAGGCRDEEDVRAVLTALEQPPSTLEVGGHAIGYHAPCSASTGPRCRQLGQGAITKLDLIRYLVRMSPLILPHVRDRPLTLFRWPGGIQGRRMLQKHPEAALPGVRRDGDDLFRVERARRRLPALQQPRHARLAGRDGRARDPRLALARRVRTIEQARRATPSSGSAASLADSAVNFPDYMLFDLDPYIYRYRAQRGEPEPNEEGFDKGRQVALWLKDVLDGMSLQSCTSRPPARPGCAWSCRSGRRCATTSCAGGRGRSASTCSAATRTAITTEWDTRKRRGKVFLDFNMNVAASRPSRRTARAGCPARRCRCRSRGASCERAADAVPDRQPRRGAQAQRSVGGRARSQARAWSIQGSSIPKMQRVRRRGCAITRPSSPWWKWIRATTRFRRRRQRTCGPSARPRLHLQRQSLRALTGHQFQAKVLPKELQVALGGRWRRKSLLQGFPGRSKRSSGICSSLPSSPCGQRQTGRDSLPVRAVDYLRRHPRKHVEHCVRMMEGRGLMAVEFRNASWWTERNRDSTLAFERERGLVNVVVDGPQVRN